LSLAIGIPVEELKDKVTAREYRNWIRYWQVAGPFGSERDDYRTALIVRAIHELKNTVIAVNGGDAEDLKALEYYRLKFKRIAEGTDDYLNLSEAQNIKRLFAKFRK
jgi:hypothetical protein